MAKQRGPPKIEPLYMHRYVGGSLQRRCELPFDDSAYRHVASVKYATTTKTFKGTFSVLVGDDTICHLEQGDAVENISINFARYNGLVERVTNDMVWIQQTETQTVKVGFSAIALA